MSQNITQMVKNNLLMILNEKKTVTLSGSKKVLALLRGITSKHFSNFYCLNCLHYFRTKNKLEFHKRVKMKISVT